MRVSASTCIGEDVLRNGVLAVLALCEGVSQGANKFLLLPADG